MKRIGAIIDRCATEPFRIFFPLGILASVVGVLLWPAYFGGWTAIWPAESHARWMVGGFGGCMIAGFLGTAGPRLLGADPWCRFEVLLHAAMAVAMMGCLALNRIAAADLLLGLWLFGVMASLAFRLLVGRKDVPPPGFPVALLGVLGAALAGIALSLNPILGYTLPTWAMWRLLYFQGLLWLPVLGVAPYLLPRFFGQPSAHSFEASATPPAGWVDQMLISLAAGLALIGTFALEAWGGLRSGLLLRSLIVFSSLALTVPGLLRFGRSNGLGWALRVVPIAAAGGWALAAWLPVMKVGMLHLMFISGAGMLMLAVACRVILGHADRHDRLASKLRWCHGLWGLVLFAATTRMFADIVPKIRISHYVYAAAMWVIVVAFWAWKLRSELRAPRRAQEDGRGTCPRRARRQRLTPHPAGPTA